MKISQGGLDIQSESRYSILDHEEQLASLEFDESK